jgi:pimeloyl-ACP methyl ester carboxylesterase
MEPVTLEMTIDDIRVGPMSSEGYLPIKLDTNRGHVSSQYYHVPGEKKAVIFVGSVIGGFDTPARNLYPKLCQAIALHNISSLRIQFRHSSDLVESALDILAGIAFLERFRVSEIALVGHAFGGAAVLQAAAAAPEVIRTVVTLATQTHGAEVAAHLDETSLLLIHGTNDEIHPVYSSTYIHDIAGGQKELLLFDGAGHVLDEAAGDVFEVVYKWLVEKLR